MNRHMIRARQCDQVLRPVVRRVAVDVMDDHSTWPWPVGRFPHDDSALTPHVRLRQLHPRPTIATTLMPDAKGDRTNRQRVVWLQSWFELRGGRASSAPVDAMHGVVGRCRARHGAVVDSSSFSGLAVECGPANRAGQVCDGVGRRRLTDNRSARDRTRHAVCIPNQSVGLDVEGFRAMNARGFHSSSIAGAGTGTTLAVAA